MLSKKILSLIIFLLLTKTLFSFSSGNKTALSNIKKVELIDKTYRTVAILPLENNTKMDEYSYIGKTIQKFLSNKLSILQNITITTDDFIKPKKYKTNKSIIYSYGTNFIRDVILLDTDIIYTEFIKSPNPSDDNYQSFAKTIGADYIIYGEYTRKTARTKENFILSYYIKNMIQNRNIFNKDMNFNIKKIDEVVDNISSEIINHFHPKEIGFIQLATDISNHELFINNAVINLKNNIYEIPIGKYEIKFQSLKHPTIITNIIISNNNTSFLSLSNKYFIKNNASLTITSEPSGASVFLNVNHIGKTPLICSNLNPELYRIQISKTNYSTHYHNLLLKAGINKYYTSLIQSPSKAYYKDKHKRNKLIMYLSLGGGALCLINAYAFYAQSELEYDRYRNLYDKKYLTKSNTYATVSFISLLAGVTGITISLIYFFKVLDYDDTNIGFNYEQKNIFYANKDNVHYLSLDYKF